MKKCVVLLSGGMDSATALAMARADGYETYAISFDYGQRHDRELQCARDIAAEAGVCEHIIVKTNMDAWGGSALTDKGMEVPDSCPGNHAIPVTYVPARNMIFLSFAASYAEKIGAQDIFIGVSEVDYSGYVDCRQAFLEAMEKAINLGTVCGAEGGKPIRIRAPLVHMSKADEIREGLRLGVDYGKTWTCYRGQEEACGTCDSCRLRLEAFEAVRMQDPVPYQQR